MLCKIIFSNLKIALVEGRRKNHSLDRSKKSVGRCQKRLRCQDNSIHRKDGESNGEKFIQTKFPILTIPYHQIHPVKQAALRQHLMHSQNPTIRWSFGSIFDEISLQHCITRDCDFLTKIKLLEYSHQHYETSMSTENS